MVALGTGHVREQGARRELQPDQQVLCVVGSSLSFGFGGFGLGGGLWGRGR